MKMSMYTFLILAIFTSCGSTGESVATQPSANNSSETVHTRSTQQNMIVGEFKKEDLQQGAYASWFNSGFEEFEPSQEAMEVIENNISEYEIIGFMGTWCPDSRRETPQFFKILEEAGYDLSNLTMIGVDRSKSTPEKLEAEYNIQRVPTFIFLKDGKEVNRYVEYPRESIEEDIAKIVSGQEYKHSYLN